jgi:hypothetical protein
VGGAPLAAVKFQHEPVQSQDAVVLVRSFGFGFLFIYAMRMAAAFVFVVSTIGARLGIFPRWLVAIGYIAAFREAGSRRGEPGGVRGGLGYRRLVRCSPRRS